MYSSFSYVLFIMMCGAGGDGADRCYEAALDGFQTSHQCADAGSYFKAITEAVMDPVLPRAVYECHPIAQREA